MAQAALTLGVEVVDADDTVGEEVTDADFEIEVLTDADFVVVATVVLDALDDDVEAAMHLHALDILTDRGPL